MIRVFLGLATAVGVGVLYLQGRAARTQVEELRTEIALARIAGALSVPPLPPVP